MADRQVDGQTLLCYSCACDVLRGMEKLLRERGVDDFVPCKVLWGLLGYWPEAKR